MDGKEQQLAGEEVPDPGDRSVTLGHGSTSATWDTLVERHSARQSLHLLLVINPILCHVHRPVASTTLIYPYAIIIIIIIYEFHDGHMSQTKLQGPDICSRNRRHKFDPRFRRQFFVPMHDF